MSNKDYTVSVTDKCKTDNDGDAITIDGKGNFTGVLNYKLKVITKNDLKKFTVAVTAPDYTYNGKSQTLSTLSGGALVVTDSSKTVTDGQPLTENGMIMRLYIRKIPQRPER